jgi:DinB superfamily
MSEGEHLVKQIAQELTSIVEEASGALRQLDERAASAATPGKWSPQQILGHLIDSAANNHQRFVRAQQVPDLLLPGYAQEFWVESQDYAHRNWLELIEFWRLYNRHLAYVISRIPADKLTTNCRIGASEPATLGWVIEDYLRHLKHHLEQIAL